jgi:hypothetical protein
MAAKAKKTTEKAKTKEKEADTKTDAPKDTYPKRAGLGNLEKYQDQVWR